MFVTFLLYILFAPLPPPMNALFEDKPQAKEETIIWVKEFSGKKYRIAFPKPPTKTTKRSFLVYESKVGSKVHRLIYHPKNKEKSFFLKSFFGPSYLFFPVFSTEQEKKTAFFQTEEGSFLLLLENGSKEEFTAFQQSFSPVKMLPS